MKVSRTSVRTITKIVIQATFLCDELLLKMVALYLAIKINV